VLSILIQLLTLTCLALSHLHKKTNLTWKQRNQVDDFQVLAGGSDYYTLYLLS